MRFLLAAQCLPVYQELEEYCMPIGIAYINGAMRHAGFDVEAINLLFEQDSCTALKKRIQEHHIDVLMCGGLTSEFKMLKMLYQTAREANPDIIIIGGGGGFTSEPILFSSMTEVDYAVIGEGEITNCELASALEQHQDVSQIKGIVFRDEMGYHMTPPREYIRNLDSLPFPSYEGLNMEAYLDCQHVDGWYNYYTYYSDKPRLMPMLMARSCPFQCSFCYHPIGKGYRTRSLDNFFQELDLWIDTYHINGIALIDECFSIDKKRVIAFCKRIKPYKLKWACQMRAETYTEDVLLAMKDSGCIGACFGIESMSEAVLKNMNKHLKKETIEQALSLTYQCRIGCTGNLIFGAEAENFETMAESLQWHSEHAVQYHNRPVRHFSYVQTYPGSIYYQHACENGKISEKADYIQKGDWNLNITELSQEEYEKMGDIICLCRMENYNCGEILEIAFTSETEADFTFRCSYCSAVNQYHHMNRKKFSRGKITELGCRNCNMLGEYLLKPEYYLYDEYVSIPWLLGKREATIPEKFFSRHGWNKIGFCGMNAFAKKMIALIQQTTDAEILYIYDHRLKPHIDYFHVPQVTDTARLSDADLIIHSDMTHRVQMQELISEHCQTPTIFLETLLRIWLHENIEKDTDSYHISSE